MGDTRMVEVKASFYFGAQMICLIASTGVCFSFIPYLPLAGDSDMQSSVKAVLYPVSRLSLAVLLVLMVGIFCYALCRKSKFHRDHSLFWPMKCRHCAKILGLTGRPPLCLSMSRTGPSSEAVHGGANADVHSPSTSVSLTATGCLDIEAVKLTPTHQSTDEDNDPVSPFDVYCSNNNTIKIERSSHPGGPLTEKENILSRSCSGSLRFDLRHSEIHDSDSPNSDIKISSAVSESHQNVMSPPSSLISQDDGSQKPDRPLFSHRHKSLINVLQVFGIMAVVGVTCDIIQMFVCFAQGLGSWASLAAQLVLDCCYAGGILFVIVIIRSNYNAVFTDKWLVSVTSAMSVGVLFWASFRQIMFPISDYFNDANEQPDISCQWDSMFKWFFRYLRELVNPCYEEFAVTCTTICIQFWTTQVPIAALSLQEIAPSFETTESRRTVARSSSIIKLLRSVSGISLQGRKPTRNTNDNTCFIRLTKVLSGLAAAVFITLNLFVLWEHRFGLTKETVEYLKRIIEICFALPFIFLCCHHFISTKSYSMFRMNCHNEDALFGGHDMLLLFCTGGIFTLYILRIASATGILLYPDNDHVDESHKGVPTDCAYAIVSASVSIIKVGLMTLFLLIIQRQAISNEEKKWTLACLIFASVMNATQWLYDVMDGSEWSVLGEYIGEHASEVITVLLEPFASLYGLHAAMIAYEAYHTLSSDNPHH